MDTNKGKETFLEAFDKNLGNIKASCKASNIARATYYLWRGKDQDFANAADEVFEGIKDMAETQLAAAIAKGRTAELIFFLKTKCKDRGYIEREIAPPSIVYNVEIEEKDIAAAIERIKAEF